LTAFNLEDERNTVEGRYLMASVLIQMWQNLLIFIWIITKL